MLSPSGIRELFHLLFLKSLLTISDPALYILKGGVNLRFFFQSPRYSEDMDIDVTGGSVQTLKKNGYKILDAPAFRRSLDAFGITDLLINDPDKSKQTETTQRFRLSLVNTAGDSFPTRIEFSRRKNPRTRAVLTEYIDPSIAGAYKQLSFPCAHYAGSEASVQKVLALAGRPQTQARDVFDLFILNIGGHASRDVIWASCSQLEREKAASALLSLDFDSYQSQVVEFLQPDVRSAYGSQASWARMTSMVLELLA